MGRVLIAALPDEQLDRYLQRADLKPLTPKTVTDRRKLADILRQVRSDGFALADEELELGLRSIAVPVRSRNGSTIAAMNTGVHAARVSADEMLSRILPVLQDNARTLGNYLG